MKDGAQKAVGQKISYIHQVCRRNIPTLGRLQRTEWNVRDSAATVVFIPDSKYRSGGTDFTIECARKYGKPYCIIHDMDRGAIFDIKCMISRLGEELSLNIAGPRQWCIAAIAAVAQGLPEAGFLSKAVLIAAAGRYRRYHARPKNFRIGFVIHPGLLPARILNHDKTLLGIPPDSVTVDNALNIEFAQG